MTIIRCVHNKNYSIINNTILSDDRLSFKAKGLWTYAMSRPDDWQFSVAHLKTVSKDGEDAVYSAIKELENCGYCIKKHIRGDKGLFCSYEYVFYETPQVKECLPEPENPETGNPGPGNRPLLSTDVLPSTEEEKTVCPTDPVGSSVQKIVKTNSMRKDIIISQDEIFRKAISERSDMSTAEIFQAWEILVECKGVVNDGYGFIKGTVDQLRTKKRMKKNQKNHSKERESRICHIQSAPENGKIHSVVDITKLL